MKIAYIYADLREGAQNSSWWRMSLPAAAMRVRGHDTIMVNVSDFAHHKNGADESVEGADLLIVQRSLFEPVTSAIRRWRDRGVAVALDADDAYHLLTPAMLAFHFWHRGLMPDGAGGFHQVHPTPLEQYRSSLHLLDGLILSTPLLAEDHRALTDEWRVFCLPNFIDLSAYTPTEPRPKVEGQVTIGWGGSVGRLSSWMGSGLLSALRTISQEKPATRFLLVGEDVELFEALPFPPERKERVPWQRIENWPNALAGFDIGVAPSHGASDERRSFIKALEYAALGIPFVASYNRTYADQAFPELGRAGMRVGNRPMGWYSALTVLLDNQAHYHSPAERERQRETARFYSLDNPANVDLIEATYARIIENKVLR